MNGTEYKIYAISHDLEGKKKEDGKIYRFWSGYLTYAGKPIAQVSGNHLINPDKYTEGEKKGQQKNQWIGFGESVTKEELAELQANGQEPETYGFANISDKVKDGEIIKTAKIVTAKIMGCVIPLSGWINRKTVNGKETDTLALRSSADDVAFWEDKLEEGTEFIVDDGTPDKEFNAMVDELALDYPKFQNFLSTYFSTSKVANANKRRFLLAKLKGTNVETETKEPAAPKKKRF